ncbi:hypothetical protein C8F01DRAFT_1377387 [Mycena amicta]|nr:hypothetical protein C8F01DRAFT_1377387 [Mycena amicta]
MSEPLLPPELERSIFEIAGRERRRVPTLLCVAKRVNAWLKPFLFQVVRVGDRSLLDLFLGFLLEHPNYAGETLRSLCFDTNIPEDEVEKLLPLIGGVRNLVLFSSDLDDRESQSELFPDLPHLQRLVGFPETLRDIIGAPGATFPNLTHLELTDGFFEALHRVDESAEAYNDWKPLALVPTLTHLSVVDIDEVSYTRVHRVLRDNPRLVCLIVVYGRSKASRYFLWVNLGVQMAGIRDARLVAGTYDDAWKEWEDAAVGTGLDYWARADLFLERKKEGRG